VLRASYAVSLRLLPLAGASQGLSRSAANWMDGSHDDGPKGEAMRTGSESCVGDDTTSQCAILSLCPRWAATHGVALYREWFTLMGAHLAAFVHDTDFV
jgi:hypothetical protein